MLEYKMRPINKTIKCIIKTFVISLALYSCIHKTATIAQPEADSCCVVDTITTDSTSIDQHSNDSWIIGEWEVQTDLGMANLNIINTNEASFMGDNGVYTIENGVIRLECYNVPGNITTFNLNYKNQTIELGGGYILRKKGNTESINENEAPNESLNQNTTMVINEILTSETTNEGNNKKIKRDPDNRKDYANVYYKSEYTLFDLYTDEPIFARSDGSYHIYIASNENKTPVELICSKIDLENQLFYKFKNYQNCKNWCDGKSYPEFQTK